MHAPFQAFAHRLQQALDQYGFEQGRGRTSALAARYGVSRETARKWLSGLSLPELERMIELARDFNAGFEWLATGRGQQFVPKYAVRDADSVAYAATGEARLVVERFMELPRDKQNALLTLLK